MSDPQSVLTSHERELLQRAAQCKAHGFDELTSEQLQALTAQEGIDFATALLYDRLRRSAHHASSIAEIDRQLRKPVMLPDLRGVTFAVAPGAFWREYPHIDADGRLLRSVAEACGCRTALIPVPSTGGLRANVRIIQQWLHSQPTGPIILASLSKGGADVKLALQEDRTAFGNVVGWLNICGMLQGTPLVEALLARRWRTYLVRLLFWWRGFDFAMVHDLHHGPGRLLDREVSLPEHMQLSTVVGFPFRRHRTNRRARLWGNVLEPLGPNDGGVLLLDVCRLPGLVYPVWGADHYLRPRGVDLRALVAAILTELAQRTGWDWPQRQHPEVA